MGFPLVKRAFDTAAAAVGLAVASPVIVAGALAMAFANRSSPFFIQDRVGLHGQPFRIIKLKTMKDLFNEAGEPLPDEQRLTLAGRVLRKTRLDELPQLINVLRGDMSLVGPRPMGVKRDIVHDPLRQAVRPGLTGLSQIGGGNSLSLPDVLRLDHAYVRAVSQKSALSALAYDLSIIARTPLALLRSGSEPNFRV